MPSDAVDAINTNADAKRLAVEVIATLVNVKKIAAQKILAPAGVPQDLIQRFLTDRNPITNQQLTKREAATIIFDELARTPGKDIEVIGQLIALASAWNDFHLAKDEYVARGVVQKARQMHGVLLEITCREKEKHDEKVQDALDRNRRALAEAVRQQSPLLLAQFDDAMSGGDLHQRGYLLQDLLNRLFDLHKFPVQRAFQRNGGSEQIDGAFEMEGWHYIVECRWRAQLANIRELDGLCGQVNRSGHQTMGLFLSINGWSDNVPTLLQQNSQKRIFLMDGVDLRSVLAQHIDLRKLIKAKLSHLNLRSDPYIGVAKILSCT